MYVCVWGGGPAYSYDIWVLLGLRYLVSFKKLEVR